MITFQASCHTVIPKYSDMILFSWCNFKTWLRKWVIIWLKVGLFIHRLMVAYIRTHNTLGFLESQTILIICSVPEITIWTIYQDPVSKQKSSMTVHQGPDTLWSLKIQTNFNLLSELNTCTYWVMFRKWSSPRQSLSLPQKSPLGEYYVCTYWEVTQISYLPWSDQKGRWDNFVCVEHAHTLKSYSNLFFPQNHQSSGYKEAILRPCIVTI